MFVTLAQTLVFTHWMFLTLVISTYNRRFKLQLLLSFPIQSFWKVQEPFEFIPFTKAMEMLSTIFFLCAKFNLNDVIILVFCRQFQSLEKKAFSCFHYTNGNEQLIAEETMLQKCNRLYLLVLNSGCGKTTTNDPKIALSWRHGI